MRGGEKKDRRSRSRKDKGFSNSIYQTKIAQVHGHREEVDQRVCDCKTATIH